MGQTISFRKRPDRAYGPILSVCLVLFIAGAFVVTHAQEQSEDSRLPSDPFGGKIASFELKEETIFDGLSKLSQSQDVAFSIENAILPRQAGRGLSNPKFTSHVEGKTLSEILDWLCELDSRFAWERDGNTANVFPRDKLGDGQYFMNRAVPELQIHEVREGDKIFFEALHKLSPPGPNVGVLQIAVSLKFDKPWTVSFTNLTVRRILNRIAQHIGPTYGWQLGGDIETPLVMFHQRLGRPSNLVRPQKPR